MKKIIIYCHILLILITVMSACNNSLVVESADIETAQMTSESLDELRLGLLNKDLNTDYESFEEALNKQISIYEAKNNNENLYKVCLVLYEMPEGDMITEYIGKFLDNIADDNAYYDYVNSNWNELFRRTNMSGFMVKYLSSAYDSGNKDMFRYVVSNLELYVADSQQIVMTAAGTATTIDGQGTQEEYRLLKDVLLQCEKTYGDKVDTIYQAVIASGIAKCAERLGEADLAEEYTEKKEDLLKTIPGDNWQTIKQ